MKKIYKKPSIISCTIAADSLLAGSLSFDNPEELGSGSLDARHRGRFEEFDDYCDFDEEEDF